MSEAPVERAPPLSQPGTRPALTGSVTMANTMGIDLSTVACATCDTEVVTVRISLGFWDVIWVNICGISAWVKLASL